MALRWGPGSHLPRTCSHRRSGRPSAMQTPMSALPTPAGSSGCAEANLATRGFMTRFSHWIGLTLDSIATRAPRARPEGPVRQWQSSLGMDRRGWKLLPSVTSPASLLVLLVRWRDGGLGSVPRASTLMPSCGLRRCSYSSSGRASRSLRMCLVNARPLLVTTIVSTSARQGLFMNGFRRELSSL